MHAPSETIETVKAAIHREGPEVVRSFAAGAAYMAAIIAVGGIAAAGTVTLTRTTIPQLVEQISPSKFPRYAANDLNRADRWNPDRWDTEIADEHGNDRNAAKVAIVDDALRGR